jgi:hypothetical protein
MQKHGRSQDGGAPTRQDGAFWQCNPCFCMEVKLDVYSDNTGNTVQTLILSSKDEFVNNLKIPPELGRI